MNLIKEYAYKNENKAAILRTLAELQDISLPVYIPARLTNEYVPSPGDQIRDVLTQKTGIFVIDETGAPCLRTGGSRERSYYGGPFSAYVPAD